jgi:ParB-like chromosome segregation protein Spo0J
MKVVSLRPEQIEASRDLERSKIDKQFEERLQASIEQIGLVEPLKVAEGKKNRYVIVDGVLRWRVISAIRATDSSRFATIPAYVVKHEQRFEVRYQTDIYQDLLPSQLAQLVEHLHQVDGIQKSQIAAYIGVSAPTLRNYTGLARLIERGGLFARVVEMMDVGVVPASNPFAWLRLTEKGLHEALSHIAGEEKQPSEWIDEQLELAAAGRPVRLALKDVETITGSLAPDCYREDEEVRSKKRELGLRRGKSTTAGVADNDLDRSVQNLATVIKRSKDPVLRLAAESLKAALT